MFGTIWNFKLADFVQKEMKYYKKFILWFRSLKSIIICTLRITLGSLSETYSLISKLSHPLLVVEKKQPLFPIWKSQILFIVQNSYCQHKKYPDSRIWYYSNRTVVQINTLTRVVYEDISIISQQFSFIESNEWKNKSNAMCLQNISDSSSDAFKDISSQRSLDLEVKKKSKKKKQVWH